ncbi:MAG: dehypoxanthine futalosine cyclase, partial [Candidatus Electrothrix sp. AR5]|nr:dehypoxanthine futalosine cyclase [Candidatus Electrothrix sp. AR5]
MQQITDKVIAGERITGEEFLLLADKADLYQLGFMADAVRKRLHPEPQVTYVIDRNINYTDICISACTFCAFFKAPEDSTGSLLSKDELLHKIS